MNRSQFLKGGNKENQEKDSPLTINAWVTESISTR